MSYYYNQHTSPRLVVCVCGHIFRSQVETCQCSKCKERFNGDDHQYKTNEDRVKERKEMHEKMLELETNFNNALETIRKMRKQLKPLD